MAEFVLTKIKSKQVFDLLRKRNIDFLEDVKRRWSDDAHEIISLIIRTQLTQQSDTSLKRRSGNASRALMAKTRLFKGAVHTVQNNFYIDQNNPASTYLPIHDKSYKGSRIIRPKNAEWLKFKTADGNWVTTKKVRIPVRTNMMPILTKRAKKKFVTSVNASLKRFANA